MLGTPGRLSPGSPPTRGDAYLQDVGKVISALETEQHEGDGWTLQGVVTTASESACKVSSLMKRVHRTGWKEGEVNGCLLR